MNHLHKRTATSRLFPVDLFFHNIKECLQYVNSLRYKRHLNGSVSCKGYDDPEAFAILFSRSVNEV